jgi:endonuclease/exonuclease/phosphatase (EEP) superfamily protein YafD
MSARPLLRSTAAMLLAVALLLPTVAAAAPAWLPRHPDTTLRVLVWNVSRESFFENAAGFRRVLDAVSADLLMLDEMPGTTKAAAIARGLPRGEPRWNVVYGSAGGRHQRPSLAARFELQPIIAFEQLGYDPAQAADWRRRAPAPLQARLEDTLDGGVPAVGAVFARDGRRVLAVGLDLQCCGDEAGSWEEERRVAEATAIRAALDATLAQGGIDAVLLGGDFNVVGGPAPLQVLQGDGNGLPLQAVDVRHRDGVATWTWDGRGTPFPSSRIDYLLHSAALRPLQAQVFDTEGLSAAEQQALDLPAGLSATLSQHRPLVVDFTWADGETGQR